MIGHFGHPVRELGGLCERYSSSETGQLKIAVHFIAISYFVDGIGLGGLLLSGELCIWPIRACVRTQCEARGGLPKPQGYETSVM